MPTEPDPKRPSRDFSDLIPKGAPLPPSPQMPTVKVERPSGQAPDEGLRQLMTGKKRRAITIEQEQQIGMEPMRETAIKAAGGITALEELSKVTGAGIEQIAAEQEQAEARDLEAMVEQNQLQTQQAALTGKAGQAQQMQALQIQQQVLMQELQRKQREQQIAERKKSEERKKKQLAAVSQIKKAVVPDTTAKILDAGAPGLGLFYRFIKKITA